MDRFDFFCIPEKGSKYGKLETYCENFIKSAPTADKVMGVMMKWRLN